MRHEPLKFIRASHFIMVDQENREKKLREIASRIHPSWSRSLADAAFWWFLGMLVVGTALLIMFPE